MTSTHYFITCEKNSPIVGIGTIHRVLPATRILYTWCCRPSEEGPELPERYVVKLEKGIFTRAEILRTKGVVRVRTFDGAKNHILHRFC